ncbi:deoxyguanosinetriphosphate triphosphohydrolase family protein [Mycetocola reblochoni]|uniref:Deoxyguanosinetriphosphate triphosphohydrolase n=2 Tax=Mycetocola reblochoni TaxID=331618 RepID=A0A1R4IW61_9MICO|nr:dNTP triphosphohydrolase [Mycetocola reblochoni]RLP70983.1 dNTP triphosphohydrolase [Mycetocola reblochoni]SJN23958.1 Deoxyguanosinetriphosphate triphosphohydrolase [Mycetocola reblochoni REB411]
MSSDATPGSPAEPSPVPARHRREIAEPLPEGGVPYPSFDFRTDLERIRFSPYFSRLSAVTQVVPQTSAGPVIHNRLTHSIKVTAVAREIAVTLANDRGENGRRILRLGGCEPVVVQAAASAHDLGHPPFGHLGEQVLDRLARQELGLPEGFEGNAQTFRILAALDTNGLTPTGLNLTAAVRAAVLKYPWTRLEWRDRAPLPDGERPRGVGDARATGAHKFSVYSLHAAEVARVRAAYPGLDPWQQTVECSVMDVADDIAYSIHDLDDFYRAGVLQQTAVSGELRAWLRDEDTLAERSDAELRERSRTPGHGLETLWRRMRRRDPWIADPEAFRLAVEQVSIELGDTLLAIPFDGGGEAERAITAFTARWLDRFKRGITVDESPNVRSGVVRLSQQSWHDVNVLKFVHTRFVLDRPDLATVQRGQGTVIETLVRGFTAWLQDPDDAARAPRRLLESMDVAIEDYALLRREHPNVLSGPTDDASIIRRGRGRAVIDYVASLSDSQALSIAATISGGSDRLWSTGAL